MSKIIDRVLEIERVYNLDGAGKDLRDDINFLLSLVKPTLKDDTGKPLFKKRFTLVKSFDVYHVIDSTGKLSNLLSNTEEFIAQNACDLLNRVHEGDKPLIEYRV